jgi:hypothetical protein
VFNDQIHSNLVSLILHVNDESPEVQRAAKGALRKLGPLTGSDELAAYFNSKALDEGRQVVYPDFLHDVSKLLVHKLTPI